MDGPGAAAVPQPPAPAGEAVPARASSTGSTGALLRGQGTEFDSLREYVIGDDVRSIDWRATARRGDVWYAPGGPSATGASSSCSTPAGPRRAGSPGTPRLDTAMDAALLLTALAARAGDRIDFLAFDRRTRAKVVGASRSSVLSAVTDAMAAIEPELVETDAAALPAPRSPPRAIAA